MQTGRWTLAALALAGVAALAHADTLRVPQENATIQAAVDAAVDDDTIVVSRGTYNEHVVVDGKHGLTIQGKRATWDGLVDGMSRITLHVRSHRVTVRGFVFRRGDIQVLIAGADAVVESCRFRRAGRHGHGSTMEGLLNQGQKTEVTRSRFAAHRIDVAVPDSTD